MAEFLMYGRENCGFCDKAKALFLDKNQNYEYKDVNLPFVKQELLLLNPEAKTVPQIFITEGSDTTKLIGGYTELADFYNQKGTTE